MTTTTIKSDLLKRLKIAAKNGLTDLIMLRGCIDEHFPNSANQSIIDLYEVLVDAGEDMSDCRDGYESTHLSE